MEGLKNTQQEPHGLGDYEDFDAPGSHNRLPGFPNEKDNNQGEYDFIGGSGVDGIDPTGDLPPAAPAAVNARDGAAEAEAARRAHEEYRQSEAMASPDGQAARTLPH